MNDIGILDSQIEGHTPGRSKRITPNLLLRNPTQTVPMVHNQNRQQRHHPRTQRVTREHHLILGTVLHPQLLQRLRLPIQQPHRRLQQPTVHVPAVEHLLPQPVIKEDFVVTLIGQVEATHRQHNLLVLVVEVDEVGRRTAERVLMGHALYDPVRVQAVAGGRLVVLGVSEIGVVVGEDEAADSRHRVKLVGGGGRPRGAVVASNVGAALPEPPCAAQHEYALHHPA